MKHLGDITQISGYDVEPVDVVCGGSPCQDLSIAGKQAGLKGERSGLFLHQIRIIKEMRERDRRNGLSDEFIRPRFMLWENVLGAFSSGGGRDFKRVLEETIKIAEPDADVLPMPKTWSKSGCIYDELGRWSVAWRVHDAQFWGVPQRRKRIALVADFGGLSAGEVLFERKGMLWNPPKGSKQGQGAAGSIGEGIEEAGATTLKIRGGKSGGQRTSDADREKCDTCDISRPDIVSTDLVKEMCLNDQGGKIMNMSYGKTGTLRACMYKGAPIVLESHPMDSRIKISEGGIIQTLSGRMGTGGGNVPMILEHKCYGIGSKDSNAWKSKNPKSGIYEATTAKTLDLNGGNPNCNQGGVIVLEGNGSRPSHQGDGYKESDVMYTLNATEQHAVCVNEKGADASNQPVYTTSHAFYHTHAGEDKAYTLTATDFKDPPTVAEPPEYIVRRLTPLECERLQGFPDNWTLIGEPEEKEVTDYDIEYDADFNIISKTKTGTHKETVYKYTSNGKIRECSDAARYKALGNSIALPFWKVLARKISAQYDRDITIGSLFDGIGGFPIAFEHCGGKALWASEVEEFCIAVTKERFGED